MKTALILGVDGQDGSYLAEFLLTRKYKVIGWVPETIPMSKTNIQHIINQLTLIKGDLRDQNSLVDYIEEFKPDEIYNLASPSSPSTSWNDSILVGEVTAVGVTRLLEAIRAVHPKGRFLQASSSELFGNPLNSPQNENTPFHPRNPYGIAKLYAHWATVNYRKHYGIFAVSCISFNHESPRRGLGFVSRKITHGATQIKIGLANELRLGNLKSSRDWGYAGDYIKAMWMMLQQNDPDDFVIGTGHLHTVGELCEVAFGYLGLDYRNYVVQDEHFFRPTEKIQLVADSSKARKLLGWQPSIPFDQIVILMVEDELSKLSEQISKFPS